MKITFRIPINEQIRCQFFYEMCILVFMSFCYPIQTRYSETAQDGIIHHSSYVIYLEEARIAYFRSIGCEINALEKHKQFCIVIDLFLKYLKPLNSGEEIEVRVTLANHTKVRFQLNYEIYRGKTLTTTASTSHCFINEEHKPIPIPTRAINQE